MNEGVAPAIALAWRFVDNFDTSINQLLELGIQVRDFQADMVHARSALRQELAHATFGARRLDELDFGIAQTQESDFHRLGGRRARLTRLRQSQTPAPEIQRGIQIVDDQR